MQAWFESKQHDATQARFGFQKLKLKQNFVYWNVEIIPFYKNHLIRPYSIALAVVADLIECTEFCLPRNIICQNAKVKSNPIDYIISLQTNKNCM